jgi:hypothetical protein
MILLVIGLVAVIVVVLIAVFLSIRLGRGDEDEEPELRSGGRDRRRDQDERWPERDTRRTPPSARAASRGGSSRERGEYAGYSSRGPAREREPDGRDGAARRPARPEAPGYRTQARPAVAASAPARGRHDTGPSRRHADDYPSMDFGPGGDHPSGEFPVDGQGATAEPRDRAARHKTGAGAAAAKSRPKQRGKRGDDDDWPSSEWDKLSDEQYWAELSADKPLSSMARPAKSATGTAAAPANGNGTAKPPAREPRLASRPAPERDRATRNERAGRREPATEQLPVRATARSRQAPPAPPPARRDADLAGGRSYPEPQALLDTGPRSRRDTGPVAARDTGPQPRAGHRRRDSTAPHAPRDRDPATLSGPAGAPSPIPGALEDDPLTSPSFSLKAVPATDSRSYSNARKHAKTAGPSTAPGAAAHANGNGHGSNGNGNGSHRPNDYSDPGYAYQAAPPAAVPPPAPSAEWYNAPAARTQPPAYGNPYQHAGGGNGNGAASYPGYLVDPLRVYSPSGHEAQAPYAEPTGQDPYQGMPSNGSAPYADSYPGHPYPEQAGYRSDGPSYDQGYHADPYAAGGYGPYPRQG